MDPRAALRDIRHLAADIGPREATSRNFAEAATFVERRFERLGYDVRRTTVGVPAGISWGTPVRRGTSVNVIAEPNDFDASDSHVVVGAHLDTVPVAPGAEDNASGIAVMLQFAAMVSGSQQDAGAVHSVRCGRAAWQWRCAPPLRLPTTGRQPRNRLDVAAFPELVPEKLTV